MFEPGKRLLGNRINIFRRLHRKIVVIDRSLGFVGGINYSVDHLVAGGEKSKQDYAVEVEGPVVADIHALACSLPHRDRPRPAPRRWWQYWRRRETTVVASESVGGARVLLASRDNQMHRDDIERLYRIAIRSARQRVVIANAYFFPGYRLIRDLRKAARRGVEVTLIMQGNPDMPFVRFLTTTLYAHLARAGVHIYEYCARPIHAKVALVDEDWSTVGSSNLDPLSLALNLEANLFIQSREFNAQLHANLEGLMRDSCKQLDADELRRPRLASLVLGYIAYHATRRFPGLIRALPASPPNREALTAPRTPLAGDSR